MSSPAREAASGKPAGPAAPFSNAAPSLPAHDFFQKVYTHLKEGQLKSVKALLDGADASTHAQLPANKGTIWEFVSKDGLTNDARAENLVKVLQKSKLFPEVKPEEFEKDRMLGLLSSAITGISPPKIVNTGSSAMPVSIGAPAISAYNLVETNTEVMQQVRLLGMRAGLTESQVNEALEECLLPNGRRFWMVKATHNDTFKAWEDSLITLASKEEIIFFQEGMERADLPERQSCLLMGLQGKGFFRGLETDNSAYKVQCVVLLDAIGRIVAMNRMDRDTLHKPLHIVVTLSIVAYPFAMVVFDKAIENEKHSTAKIARAIMDEFFSIWEKKKTPREVADELIKTYPNPKTWFEFAETFFPAVFADAPYDLQKALITYLQAKRKFLTTRSVSTIEGPYKELNKQYTAVRDPGYARIFLNELANLPAGKTALVWFGAGHAPGFRSALNARSLVPLSSSSSSSGNSKADSKETKAQS